MSKQNLRRSFYWQREVTFERAMCIKFLILFSSKSFNVAPLSQEASNGRHRIYSFSSKYLIKEAYTEVHNPSISIKVLRTISCSTFLINAVSLGCLFSSPMLFIEISRCHITQLLLSKHDLIGYSLAEISSKIKGSKNLSNSTSVRI